MAHRLAAPVDHALRCGLAVTMSIPVGAVRTSVVASELVHSVDTAGYHAKRHSPTREGVGC